MTISFNDVPQSARASKIYIELAGVKRSLASLFIPPTGLLIGQYDPGKTATVDYIPLKVLSSDDVGNRFGFGSHIHRQALRFPASVFLQGGGVYAVPVPEAAGDAAEDTITYVGTATSSGTFHLLIGDEVVQVAVADEDTETEVATATAAAITAIRDIAVTSSGALGVVTNVAKFKGTAGNQILQVINPGGEAQEAENPSGLTIALGNADGYLSTGATDPSVEDIFFDAGGADVLGDRWYTAATMPFTDETNIGWHVASGEARKAPSVNRMFANYGAYVKEIYSAALALPDDTNSEWVGQVWDPRYQAPMFEMSAALVGVILEEQNKAPNRPYKNLEVSGSVDDSVSNLKYLENDALYRAGMSFCNTDSTGSLRFGDIALTRRLNDLGGDTEEWFDAVSLHARQAKAYSIEQIFLSDKYSRGVVVDNDAVTAVDYAIAPKDVVAELTKLIQDLWIPYAWSKNEDEILASLSAEINDAYHGRIDSELTDDEAKALRILAIRYAYLY